MTHPHMTPTNDAPVTVEQCDRESAAKLAEWLTSVQQEWDGMPLWFAFDAPRAFRAGAFDSHEFVQSHARHRLAALASARADEEATYTRWLAGDETLPTLPREQYLRFQARSDRAIKDRQTAPATVGNDVAEVRRNPDDCEWTYCPACKTGFLDTGYECNSCGFDAQPLVHLQSACEQRGERMHPSGLYESEIANPIRQTTLASAPAGDGGHLAYERMGSGGRCDWRHLREAVSEAVRGVREVEPDERSDIYTGHRTVPQINFNSLDRIVTAFVDAALAHPHSAVAPDGDGVERALQTKAKWDQACERHTDLLRTAEATDPRVRRSGGRCASLYSQLCQEAIASLARPRVAVGEQSREAGLRHAVSEAKRSLRLVQGCLECNADDERQWAETIEWLERLV